MPLGPLRAKKLPTVAYLVSAKNPDSLERMSELLFTPLSITTLMLFQLQTGNNHCLLLHHIVSAHSYQRLSACMHACVHVCMRACVRAPLLSGNSSVTSNQVTDL